MPLTWEETEELMWATKLLIDIQLNENTPINLVDGEKVPGQIVAGIRTAEFLEQVIKRKKYWFEVKSIEGGFLYKVQKHG